MERSESVRVIFLLLYLLMGFPQSTTQEVVNLANQDEFAALRMLQKIPDQDSMKNELLVFLYLRIGDLNSAESLIKNTHSQFSSAVLAKIYEGDLEFWKSNPCLAEERYQQALAHPEDSYSANAKEKKLRAEQECRYQAQVGEKKNLALFAGAFSWLLFFCLPVAFFVLSRRKRDF